MKFYNTLEEYNDKNVTIFVDMDGVIAEYDIGNFDYNTIRPLKTNIKRIEELQEKENITVKILSICKNNKIVDEKLIWINKYMPFFNIKNAIFLSKEMEEYKGIESCDLKSNYLKEHMNESDATFLVDDDNQIIKHVRKNNQEVIVFQVSSWID